METATRAAAAGGITTVIDMPLNNEPTTTTSRLVEQKIWASWVPPRSTQGSEDHIYSPGALQHPALFESPTLAHKHAMHQQVT